MCFKLTQYFLPDALGSVRQMTDASGAISLAKYYDPYGQALANLPGTDSQSTDFGYTGEQSDPSGLLYLRARSYDPETGRFTSRDSYAGDASLPQSLNRYAYAMGNPIRYTDPSGHCVDGFTTFLCAAIGGAAIFGGLDAWKQLQQNGGRWDCLDWTEIAKYGAAGAVFGVGFIMASAGLIPIPLFLLSAAPLFWDAAQGNPDAMLLDAAFGMLPLFGAAFEEGADLARLGAGAEEAMQAGNESFNIDLFGFRGIRGDLAEEFMNTEPLIYAGHVGFSLDAGETIYAFTPVTPDIMNGNDVLEALKAHVIFPGQVRDDIAIFQRAQELAEQGYGTQVYRQTISVSGDEFARIRSGVMNDMANSPLFDKTYRFPEPPYDNCAPYNCATWPASYGIPIPESTGILRFYIKALAEIGVPWIRR